MTLKPVMCILKLKLLGDGAQPLNTRVGYFFNKEITYMSFKSMKYFIITHKKISYKRKSLDTFNCPDFIVK